MRKVKFLGVLFSVSSMAMAAEFEPLITCNNRELVIDRELGPDLKSNGKLQVVINGKLPIDTLLFPVEGINNTINNLDISFSNNKNSMFVSNLLGAKRSGEFVHIYEGAGYHPFEMVSNIISIFDLEYIGNRAVDQLPTLSSNPPEFIVDFFLSDERLGTGIGGYNPIRNNNSLKISMGKYSNYIFKSCLVN